MGLDWIKGQLSGYCAFLIFFKDECKNMMDGGIDAIVNALKINPLHRFACQLLACAMIS